MKKIVWGLSFVIGFVFLMSVNNTSEVSAYGTKNRPNLISSWNVTGDVVENGSVTGFKVSISFGADCKDGNTGICSIVGGNKYTSFTCGDSEQMHWDNNSSLWNNGSISISYSKKDSEYYYYKATIKPSDWYSGAPAWTVHQRIHFTFKRKRSTTKKHTLTSIAVTKHDGTSLGQIAQVKDIVDGDGATVSGNAAIAGYEFVGWNSTCPGPDNVNITCLVDPVIADTTVQAVYGTPRYLTAYAWDRTTWSALNGGNPIDGTPRKTWYNEAAAATRPGFTGYSFAGWDIGGTTACANSAAATCTISNLTENTTVYAYYDRNTFAGRSVLSGGGSADTGYQTTNTYKSATISNCSPVSGCTATFDHFLKTASGSGTTSYNIQRHSNLITSTRAISGGTVVSDRNWDGTVTSLSHSSFTIYPGMALCEWINFVPYYGSSAQYTQVCAFATGNAQPDDPSNPDDPESPDSPSGDRSFINIKVRNSNVAAYNDYQRTVYAKPGDTLYYRASYYPLLQYTYNIMPGSFRIDGGADVAGGGKTIGTLFNSNKGTLKNWNNAFFIQGVRNEGGTNTATNFSVDSTDNFTNPAIYEVGNSSVQSPAANSKTVEAKDVGYSINERAITNLEDATKTTPGQVSFSVSNESIIANVSTVSRERTAYARVPYNYENTIRISTPESNIYYAGEEGSIQAVIKVNQTRNDVTDGTYATKVPNAMWKLEVCYGKDDSDCSETDAVNLGDKDGTLNSEGNPDGVEEKKTIDFNAKDVPAGTDICIKAAVYPENSGSDTNWEDKKGNNNWAWSDGVCYKIAKRPSIQVLGGSLYLSGNISTALSEKKHLAGYNDYKVTPNNDSPYVFGSWDELGVISDGDVKGFASGASLGYVSNNNDGTTYPDPYAVPNARRDDIDSPGGYHDKEDKYFCELSILTIANSGCKGVSETVGAIGTKDPEKGMKNDEEAIKRITQMFGSNDSRLEIESDEIEVAGDIKSAYYYKEGLLKIDNHDDSSDVAKGETILVHATDDITIKSNIKYVDAGYSKFSETPKVIIYSEKDIIIDCSVGRIDALLMADKVNTCESSNINSRANATQLTIYGSIIAKQLIANRTYGAATGVNSIVPAEIIDFDPTLYLWEGVESSDSEPGDQSGDDGGDSSSESSSVDIVYTKELAPRL